MPVSMKTYSDHRGIENKEIIKNQNARPTSRGPQTFMSRWLLKWCEVSFQRQPPGF